MPLNFKEIYDPPVAPISLAGPLILNVRAFHALGNGVTDDSAAIQEAIDYIAALGGGTVFFPLGTYLCLTKLTMRSNVSLVCWPGLATIKAGSDIGSILPAGWFGLIQIRDPAATLQITNVTFDGLTFDASSQVHTPTVLMQGVTGITFRNCTFKAAGSSAIANILLLGGSTPFLSGLATDRVKFIDCEFAASSTAGLVFAGGTGATTAVMTNIEFIRCYVHDNDHDGINNFMQASGAIQGVLFDDCLFRNNGKNATAISNMAHINDTGRFGWVDTEVRSCRFLRGGADYCGAFGDHGGWNVRIHHSTFILENTPIWPIAVGNTNSFPVDRYSQYVWIEDNYFEGNNTFDLDSTYDLYIRRNVFYRVNGRPLGAFGNHKRNYIEDNWFIECGQGSPVDAYAKAAISLGSTGFWIRRNVFLDEQTVPTMLVGVVENNGNLNGPLVYEDNDFSGVPTPITKSATYDGVRETRRNRGLNPGTPVVQGLGPSPFTFTAGDSPETFHVRNSGDGINISKGGVQIVSNGAGNYTAAIAMEPHEQIVITYPGPTVPTCYRDLR